MNVRGCVDLHVGVKMSFFMMFFYCLNMHFQINNQCNMCFIANNLRFILNWGGGL